MATKKIKPYKPNHIPARERALSLILALFLIIHGTIGLYKNDIHVSLRRGPFDEHFNDFPMWMLYIAFLAGAANLLTVIFDHYDKRDNEIN